MMKGSKFGRRPGRDRAVGVRSRRSDADAETAQPNTEEAPLDPVRTAVFFFAGTVAFMVACMVGVWLAAPDVVTTAEIKRSRSAAPTQPGEMTVEQEAASQPAEAESQQVRAQAL